MADESTRWYLICCEVRGEHLRTSTTVKGVYAKFPIDKPPRGTESHSCRLSRNATTPRSVRVRSYLLYDAPILAWAHQPCEIRLVRPAATLVTSIFGCQIVCHASSGISQRRRWMVDVQPNFRPAFIGHSKEMTSRRYCTTYRYKGRPPPKS